MMNEFLDNVINAVDYSVNNGDYAHWIDLCVEIPIPEKLLPGMRLVIWGEENDEDETYFSIWFRSTGDDSARNCSFTDTQNLGELRVSVERAINDAMNKSPVKKKSKKKYMQGGPIWSLDVLADQEFVFFNGKLYHKGWFGSWQFHWTVVQLRRGSILYAIRNDTEREE